MSDASGLRFFGTNLKMNQTAEETARFVAGLSRTGGGSVQRFVIAAGILLGAQNMHWAESGELTGEISGRMLRSLGVDLVLVGHAERRDTFGETDAQIRRKVEAALAHDLRVLLCVGDTAAEHRCGAAVDTVLRQARLALEGVTDRSRVIVAYEPVWAIGEGSTPAEPGEIRPVVAALREWLGETPLLYGGSVDARSAPGYVRLPGIDGLFVGRAAWTPAGFANVLQAAAA